MTETQRILALLATIGSGLSAGAFFTFSTFVMPALHKLPAANAVGAMQSINRLAPNALGLVLFAPLLLGGWLVVALLRRPGRTTAYVIAGTACVLLGLIVLVAYHIPHNNALDKVDAHGASAAAAWRDYYGGWAAWNHVRTVAFTAATALFALALRSVD